MGKHRSSIIVIALILCAGVSSAGAMVSNSDPFSLAWDREQMQVGEGRPFDAVINISVPRGYFLYADKLDVDFITLEGIHLDDIVYPPSVLKKDPLTGESVEMYARDVDVVVKGRIPLSLGVGTRELIARVYYQGCSSKHCFRPRTKDVELEVRIVQPESVEREAARGIRSLLKAADFAHVLNAGVIWTLLVVLLAGVLTSLTPCVWPVIPVMLVVIGVERQRSFMRNAFLALSLVAGLVLVYSVLGIAAVALGRNLGFIFQQRWFVVLVAVFFIAMSLSLFGVFEIQLSKRWAHRFHQLGGEGFRGAFLSGLGLGLIASPCSGPVIAALLGYVALQKSYFIGFALVVVYGLGMGMIIVALGAAYGMVADKLRSGPWMVWVKRSLGVVLLIPAAFYVGSLLHWKPSATAKERPIVEWVEIVEDGIEFARRSGRPLMLDFYADWCPPCRKLDKSFFNRNDIVGLSYQLVPVRVNATYESDRVRRLMDKYGVMGMPTFIFLSPQGKSYEDLRVTSWDAGLLEQNMREAIRRARGEKK